MFFLDKIWLIPVLPLIGAAGMFFFGKKLSNRAVSVICVGAVALAFVIGCGAVWQLSDYSAANHGAPFEKVIYTWLGTGSADTALTFKLENGAAVPFHADFGFLLDPLSAIWLLFVTGVGMIIHIYATGYMAHEGGYYRFVGYMNLFMFSMLTLVLANNYALLFVGWEGVGLCSYLLIGFYFKKHSASTAANKAFIVNRIGDAGFILGMFTTVWYFGSMQFTTVSAMARANAEHLTGSWVMFIATLMLFIGACGKSAQLPLYVWLPDAMEGPTPVSALIHAATMVTAGVYMVARSNALFVLAPDTMKIVAIVGALTAIFAASIGLVQNDIKRVLAYSTVSQLGYMFLALGVGAFAAGVFHVFTHAFFKALLFLGAGSVIHAMSGEQDVRFMGGLAKKIPTTFRTMFIATLAIAGIPGLAGFFSKDEILWQTWSSQGGAFRVLYGLAFVTAFMTAFYMFRLIYLTFLSPPRMSHEVEHHVHESPKSMTVPLIVLAIGSIFAGYPGVPASLGGSNYFEHYLAPVFESAEHQVGAAVPAGQGLPAHHDPMEYILMGASVGAALLGWFMANRAYAKADKDYREPIDTAAPPVYRALFNKYWVDELYDYLFTGRKKLGSARLGAQGLGNALCVFDANVVDGAVNGAGWFTRTTSAISIWWDKWIIDGVGVHTVPFTVWTAGKFAQLFQWGLVQWYALVMIAGLLGFVAYYVVR